MFYLLISSRVQTWALTRILCGKLYFRLPLLQGLLLAVAIFSYTLTGFLTGNVETK